MSRRRAAGRAPAQPKPALTYVQNNSIAPYHILDPHLTQPPRSICGVRLLSAEAWSYTDKPQGKVCGNCERMRASAESTLEQITRSA